MNENAERLLAMLQEVGSLIDETARYLDVHPEDELATLNLMSYRATAEELRENLGALLSRYGGALIDYRLYSAEEKDDAPRSLAVVGASYQAFQMAFTATREAIAQGPRKKAPREFVPESSRLYVAGTYRGSFGSTFYTGGSSDLLSLDAIEEVLSIFEAFIEAASPDDLRVIAREYGMNCARKIAHWVSVQQAANVAVSAALRVGDARVRGFDLSLDRLGVLGGVMALSSTVRTGYEVLTCRLVAVDVRNDRFTIESDTRIIAGEIDTPEGGPSYAVPSVGTAYLTWREEERLLDETPKRQYRLFGWNLPIESARGFGSLPEQAPPPGLPEPQ